jgi:hypothetical protein
VGFVELEAHLVQRCQLLHQHAQGGLRTLGRGRKIIGNVEPDLDRVSWDGDFDRQASASAGQPDRVVLVQSRENSGSPISLHDCGSTRSSSANLIQS